MTGAEVDGRAAVRYTARLAELGGGDLAVAGGKGANLGELVGAGLPVPAGFVLTTAAYDAFVEVRGLGPRIVELARGAADPAAVEEASGRIRALFTEGEIPDAVRSQVLAAYAELGSGVVAVRSSATAEDLPGASFARQDSFLNVRGADALLAAVRACWASLWTARAMGYRARQGIDPESVSLAVVVQQMVESDAAGVLFTANPANGRRTETAISAAWGLGESVVGGAVDTDDLVVDPAAGRVLSRRTADKAVLTGYAGSGTEQRPVPYERRRATVLDDATAVALARLGARAEAHFGAPQDVEWARAGGELYVVQARPITALPEPEAAPPTDWSVRDATAFYFRASIVEQLPDPLSPLFADLVDGSVTRSLGGLFAQVFGDATVRAGELGLPTVNGYAYYYYSRAAMMRLLRLSPAAMRAVYTDDVAGKLGGIRGWREHSHPAYQHAVAGWVDRDLDDLTADGLLAGTRELLDAATVYYTAVQSIIPVAATAEITFSGFYNRLVRRAADPAAATLLVGFDSIPIRAEKSLHYLATWTKDHPALAQVLSRESSRAVLDRLGDGPPPTGVDPDVWAQWRARFTEHLDRYGHTVYNLDFVNPVPADDPAPLLDTLRFYLRGEGGDPHERQARLVEPREAATAAVRGRLDPARRAVFDRLLAWAQDTAPVREDGLADVGLAWPAMRRLLLELGHRLTAAGALGTPADVFWLRHDELASLATAWDGGERALSAPTAAVAERKALWRGRKRVTPPKLLPLDSWALKLVQPWMPAGSEAQAGRVLRGTAASAGQVTATARVLSGPVDFARMQPGDVLVAAITTPAWTTLFALASAVVTDIGGPLSHSSIVAREYGIPAVLGTAVATRHIRDGERITVDGDAGTVTLVDRTDEPDTPDAPARAGRTAVAAAAGTLGLATWLWRRRTTRRRTR